VLGGGFDLPINKHFSWRCLVSDYVWARHNYGDVVTDPPKRPAAPK